jgi:V8-like Glu-specific endopeptidase
VTRALPRTRFRRRAIAALGLAAVAGVAGPWLGATHRAGAAEPAPAVSVASYDADERSEALGHWTPERRRKTSFDLGPTGPLTRPWTGRPPATVGKLFFVNDRGDDTYCTATAVRGATRDLVVTAGHCVWAPGAPQNWYGSMVFVPGYRDGAAPHGVFPARAVVVPRAWAEQSEGDVAMVVVDPAGGRRLADAVGAQPIAFDQPAGPPVTAFGYSATRPHLGQKLLYCAGSSAVDSRTRERYVPCDMTGGASGGPWLAGFDAATGAGTVVSVNSHGEHLAAGTRMYGAELDAAAKAVYAEAQRR